MKLHDFLNVRIADLSVLYTKLHRFHWFVQGAYFDIVHEKCEELYNEASAMYDEFAERLLIIGGTPAATLKEYLALAKISEEGNEVTLEDIYKTLIKDYTFFADELKVGIDIAQDAGDEATADMFIGAITAFEKHVWMFKQTVK